MTIPVPKVRVARSLRGWGVKVRWPRTGPWARTMLFPRFVWHGPFGNGRTRWPTRQGAETCQEILEKLIDEQINSEKEKA